MLYSFGAKSSRRSQATATALIVGILVGGGCIGISSESTRSLAPRVKGIYAVGNISVAGSPNLVMDSRGNVFFPDTNDGLIGKVSPDGTQTTFAGNGPCGAGLITTPCTNSDGQGTAASFSRPYALAVDRNDNIFVADYGASYVRRISPTGYVSTTSVPLNGIECLGFAIDSGGNFYCSATTPGGWTSKNVIIKLAPDGTSFTLAGSSTPGKVDGHGTSARFDNPNGLAVDLLGNVYVADLGNFMIRKISPSGEVTTLAGNGNQGNQDGVGTLATFYFYQGLGDITVGPSGSLYVGDMDGSTGYIREIAPDGTVSTICGNGSGSVINAGPCTESGVWVNAGIAVGADDKIYFAAGSTLFSIAY